MLIGDSLPEYVFIRIGILGLRLIAPTSILYCTLLPAYRPDVFLHRPFHLPLSIWMIAEASFFLAVYLPLKTWLQHKAQHPEPPSKDERRVLLRRCLDSIPEPERYLSKWFLGASSADIKRENVKQLFAWSFLNKDYENVDEDERAELDQDVDLLEDRLDEPLEQGWGKARSLRVTLDATSMQHRPLLWYLVSTYWAEPGITRCEKEVWD